MYSVIRTVQQTIVDSIDPWEVAEYDWLRETTGQSGTASYQQRYKNFWGMNVAQLSSPFYTTYFEFLSATAMPTPTDLCQILYESSTRRDGRQTLQFSFATKLLHTINPRLPIYDSLAARFFLFEAPSSDRPVNERIKKLIEFYDFRGTEYARVIKGGQLTFAIAAFRQQFNPRQHTDEKIIDWLIWALVNLADRGALLTNQIVYE